MRTVEGRVTKVRRKRLAIGLILILCFVVITQVAAATVAS